MYDTMAPCSSWGCSSVCVDRDLRIAFWADTDHTGLSVAFYNVGLQLGQYRYEKEEYTNDPVSAFAYPVFGSFVAATQELLPPVIKYFRQEN